MTNKDVINYFLEILSSGGLKIIEDDKEYTIYKQGIKLIIAGTRTFNDYEFIKNNIMKIKNPIKEIVSGNSNRVDKLGEKFAKENNIELKIFKADWDNLGKKAGPIRNQEMANYADVALIFWDGISPGSKSMINEMKKIGKPIKVIKI